MTVLLSVLEVLVSELPSVWQMLDLKLHACQNCSLQGDCGILYKSAVLLLLFLIETEQQTTHRFSNWIYKMASKND